MLGKFWEYLGDRLKRTASSALGLRIPTRFRSLLKQTWLTVIARNADVAKWDVIHAKAKTATGAVERTTLYELLGHTKDEALAVRALDLALTDEPGKTVSAGIMTAVAEELPRTALEFVLAQLKQVNELIDISANDR